MTDEAAAREAVARRLPRTRHGGEGIARCACKAERAGDRADTVATESTVLRIFRPPVGSSMNGSERLKTTGEGREHTGYSNLSI
jgi:hypothetical protein